MITEQWCLRQTARTPISTKQDCASFLVRVLATINTAIQSLVYNAVVLTTFFGNPAATCVVEKDEYSLRPVKFAEFFFEAAFLGASWPIVRIGIGHRFSLASSPRRCQFLRKKSTSPESAGKYNRSVQSCDFVPLLLLLSGIVGSSLHANEPRSLLRMRAT